MRRIASLVLVLSCVVAAHAVSAQATPGPTPGAAVRDTARVSAVRVYLDCQTRGCDFDFMRDQIRWSTWVRDRLFADVQLLVTSLRTGSGGSEYTIEAIGLDRFKGRADTAQVFTNPNDADDVVRRQLSRTFSLLLAPYAAKTPLAARLSMAYTEPAGGGASALPVKDRWNSWVYRLSANGYANGEKQAQSRSVNFNTSANRITAAWKLNLGTNVGYDESRYDLGSDGVFLSLQRNYGGSALAVKSFGEHWSAGLNGGASYSDYFNQALSVRLAPAVEYDLFPYKEFTRRQLTFYYQVGVTSFRYKERTLYGELRETRPLHNGTVSWNAKQAWGSLNINVFGSQYLHDLARYSYGVGGNIDLRIAKGLSIFFGGRYSRVADQLYLTQSGLTDQQIIARQQALATNYRYFGNFGLSYTFGSIFNNIVNPRFGGSRGQEFF